MTMNEETMNPGSTGMFVNQGMKGDLLCSAKWMKFLCIIGCIGVALMVILGIVIFAVGSSFGAANTALGAGMGFLYLILAAIYIYPLIKGFQFANGTKAACLTDNASQLARGFSGLSAMLKFFGIITIIILVLYVFVFIGALIFGAAMMK